MTDVCPTNKKRIQCKACPWREDVDPEKDIPGGYCATKHEGLEGAIAEPGRLSFGPLKQMACHESKVGAEFVCVGWLANQAGPGNNIAVRIRILTGQFPRFELVGEQHERFKDTLPKPRRRHTKRTAR